MFNGNFITSTLNKKTIPKYKKKELCNYLIRTDTREPIIKTLHSYKVMRKVSLIQNPVTAMIRKRNL